MTKTEELASKLFRSPLRVGDVMDDFTIGLREGLNLRVSKSLTNFPDGAVSIKEVHELPIPKPYRQGVLTFFESTIMTVSYSESNPRRMLLELTRNGIRNYVTLQKIDMDLDLRIVSVQTGNSPTRLFYEDIGKEKSFRVDDLSGNLIYFITGNNFKTTFDRWNNELPAWTFKEVPSNK